MIVFSLLIIAVCIGVIHKVHSVTEEPPIDERIENWSWRARWNRTAKTEER